MNMSLCAPVLDETFMTNGVTLPLPVLLTVGYECEADPTISFLEIDAATAAKYDPVRQLLPNDIFESEIVAKKGSKSSGICSATDQGIDFSVRDTVTDD